MRCLRELGATRTGAVGGQAVRVPPLREQLLSESAAGAIAKLHAATSLVVERVDTGTRAPVKAEVFTGASVWRDILHGLYKSSAQINITLTRLFRNSGDQHSLNSHNNPFSK